MLATTFVACAAPPCAQPSSCCTFDALGLCTRSGRSRNDLDPMALLERSPVRTGRTRHHLPQRAATPTRAEDAYDPRAVASRDNGAPVAASAPMHNASARLAARSRAWFGRHAVQLAGPECVPAFREVHACPPTHACANCRARPLKPQRLRSSRSASAAEIRSLASPRESSGSWSTPRRARSARCLSEIAWLRQRAFESTR